jgi:hypothetical protein
MTWQPVISDGKPSKYAKRYGAWTVCRVTVCGVDRYECWQGRELVRWFATPSEATAWVEGQCSPSP